VIYIWVLGEHGAGAASIRIEFNNSIQKTMKDVQTATKASKFSNYSNDLAWRNDLIVENFFLFEIIYDPKVLFEVCHILKFKFFCIIQTNSDGEMTKTKVINN